MNSETKPSRADYINRFLKLGKTVIDEYRALVESFDPADFKKAKERFGKIIPEILDENKRKVLYRRLRIKSPRRGDKLNWFIPWSQNSPEEVKNFMRDYPDKTISVETILSRYSVFNGDSRKMQYAAGRLKVKGGRVNQHTVKTKAEEPVDYLLEKDFFEKGSVDVKAASETYNISKDEVRKIIQTVTEKKGRHLKKVSSDVFSLATEEEHIETENIYEKDTTLIAISGLFMGSNRQRRHLLEVLKTQIIPKEKPDFLIIDGNIAVGKPDKDEAHFLDKFNYFLDSLSNEKPSESDKLFHAQVEYIVKYFPKFGDLKVQLVGGYRDTIFKGKNIAQAVCFKREDLKYRGTRIGKFRLRSGGEIVVISAITKPWRTEQPSWPLQREADDYIASLKEKKEIPELILVGGHGVWNEIPSDPKPYLIGVPNLSKPKRGESVGVVVIKVADGKVDKVSFINLSQYLEPDILISGYDEMTKKQKTIVDLIKISPRSGGELSRQIDISKTEIAKEKLKINTLFRAQNKNSEDLIDFSEYSNQYRLNVIKPHLPDFNTKLYENLKMQCGLYLCCTHLGGRQAQPNLLKKDAVEIAIKEKIDFIAVHGDLTNGVSHHHVNEKLGNIITNHTIQEMFAAEIFTEIIKKVTEALKKPVHFIYIPGNHDKWIEEHGIIALAHFDDRLKLLLGHELSQSVTKGFDQSMNGLKIHMIHYESGGGKIKSRSSKNVIDNEIPYIIKGIKQDYHIRSGGNFHNNWFGFYKGYLAIMLGCMQAQIDYEAGRGLFPDIGFPIIKTYLKNDKLFKAEIKYYDLTSKAVSLSNEEFGRLQLEFAQNIHK